MKDERCPRSVDVGRAIDPDAIESLRMHLDACAQCRADREAFARLAELARAVPDKTWGVDRLADIRAALLTFPSPARRARSRRSRIAAYAAALTLCGASVFAAMGGHVLRSVPKSRVIPAAPVSRPAEPAEVEAPTAPTPTPPPVAAPVAVKRVPLAKRPIHRAATVGRARGLAFAASRAPSAMASLSAAAGPDEPVREDKFAAAVVEAPPEAPLKLATATPAEVAFSEGWHAMLAGHYAEAASAFDLSAVRAGRAAIAEDARYWASVALVRLGNPARGQSAMEDFLRQHAGSPRAAEVSAMLGWLLVDTGRCSEAVPRFRAATHDVVRAVRTSARAGLTAAERCDHVPPPAR